MIQAMLQHVGLLTFRFDAREVSRNLMNMHVHGLLRMPSLSFTEAQTS